ncbi:hypothetical protein NDU88_007401 [Pleurodeles waltl]|uniref:Uncharacterized protein n=1 Tax=Pleurodeles waltl TaxID=8319 RepID=A0AAV7LXK2_PLEWA|nr:hypothetical protein NDU88_007401 [Pleurodeles waltl]
MAYALIPSAEVNFNAQSNEVCAGIRIPRSAVIIAPTILPERVRQVKARKAARSRAHLRGSGRCARRSGVSLARRVAAGGRGVGRVGTVAGVERQGAQRLSARASEAERGRRASKQAQLPRETTSEHRAAILEERRLGGTDNMAAPSGKAIPLTVSLEKRQLAEAQSMAARVENFEEIIIISDEEQESQDGFNLGKGNIAVPSVSQFEKGAREDVIRESSFDGGLCKESIGGHIGSQNVWNLDEQVEFVDQDGVIIRGMVCGQTGSGGSRGRAQVLLDFWQPGVEEDNAGCDAPRFLGRLSEVTVHREAGRPSGGQSLPVKARAPLVHRKEGRVKSGAVYPTEREAVAVCSLGHGAGSVFDDD